MCLKQNTISQLHTWWSTCMMESSFYILDEKLLIPISITRSGYTPLFFSIPSTIWVLKSNTLTVEKTGIMVLFCWHWDKKKLIVRIKLQFYLQEVIRSESQRWSLIDIISSSETTTSLSSRFVRRCPCGTSRWTTCRFFTGTPGGKTCISSTTTVSTVLFLGAAVFSALITFPSSKGQKRKPQ